MHELAAPGYPEAIRAEREHLVKSITLFRGMPQDEASKESPLDQAKIAIATGTVATATAITIETQALHQGLIAQSGSHLGTFAGGYLMAKSFPIFSGLAKRVTPESDRIREQAEMADKFIWMGSMTLITAVINYKSNGNYALGSLVGLIDDVFALGVGLFHLGKEMKDQQTDVRAITHMLARENVYI